MVADANATATLVGVDALPVSSNSTVKVKVPGVTEELMGVAAVALRVSCVAPEVVKAPGEQLVPMPARPEGMDAAPLFTHQSYTDEIVAGDRPSPPFAV
jgi:hypothetical protein